MNLNRKTGNRQSSCLWTLSGLFLAFLVRFDPNNDMADKSASIWSLVRETENVENILSLSFFFFFGAFLLADRNKP